MTTFRRISHALIVCFCAVAGEGAVRLPFVKKEYTPLVFFKVPKDFSSESDAMEECVSQVEKELGVKVERLDVLRDKPSQAVIELLGSEPPLLLNRLSLQIITCPKNNPAPIDKQRVVAWAKGRRLPPRKSPTAAGGVGDSAAKVKTPVVLSEEDNAMDQDELLDGLSPLQKKGKEAIKKRAGSDD